VGFELISWGNSRNGRECALVLAHHLSSDGVYLPSQYTPSVLRRVWMWRIVSWRGRCKTLLRVVLSRAGKGLEEIIISLRRRRFSKMRHLASRHRSLRGVRHTPWEPFHDITPSVPRWRVWNGANTVSKQINASKNVNAEISFWESNRKRPAIII